MSANRLWAPVWLTITVQGKFDAPVTLVQYGDYECPYTRLSRHAVHRLQR
jgi:protein-disulfide isomerase